MFYFYKVCFAAVIVFSSNVADSFHAGRSRFWKVLIQFATILAETFCRFDNEVHLEIIVLHIVLLYSTVMNCIVLHWTTLHCVVYCTLCVMLSSKII